MNLATYITSPAIPYLHIRSYSYQRERVPIYGLGGERTVTHYMGGGKLTKISGKASAVDCDKLLGMVGKGIVSITAFVEGRGVKAEEVVKMSIIDVKIIDELEGAMTRFTLTADHAELEELTRELSIQNQRANA